MFPCQELDLTILPAQDTPWLPPPRWNRWIHPSAWKMPKCLLSLDRINQWKTMLQQLPSDLFCPQKLDCSFLSYETCPGTAQSSAQMLAPVGLGSVQQLTEKFKGIYPNFIRIRSNSGNLCLVELPFSHALLPPSSFFRVLVLLNPNFHTGIGTEKHRGLVC